MVNIFPLSLMPGCCVLNNEPCPFQSHCAASFSHRCLSVSLQQINTVHENLSLCDSWWASGLLSITFLVQKDQRNRNSSGIRMGIVRSSSVGHCAELTAKPAEAKRSPLPGGSPIKMCRNVKRKVTELDLLRSLLHCGVPATTAWHKVKTVWEPPQKKPQQKVMTHISYYYLRIPEWTRTSM